MNAMSPCPKDSPLMIAWEAHKATDEFKNSYSLATRFIAPDDPDEIERIEASGANPVTRHLKEQYVQGSLWAQFMAGFLAANPDGASPEVKAEGGRDEPVAIKPLEWDKHPDEDEWFSHDHGLYDVSEYLVYKSPVSTTAWCLKVRGILLDEDFLGPDAAKAAARDDYEQRIRSALYTHPASPPDVEAIRADERERCARIAEATKVTSSGHPQIDAPTPGDMQRAIASAIRTGGQKK